MINVDKKKLEVDDEIFDFALGFAHSIFGLHKSVTGEGIDDAFSALEAAISCDIYEFPSNTQILDWVVPLSWKCNSMKVECVATGRVIARLDHPLRVASHSNAFEGELTGKELKEKCRVARKHPNSLLHQYMYYDESWGLSLTEDEFDLILDDSLYSVVIDSEHYEGSLKVAEKVINGQERKEVAFLSHMCHPAQFNDGLSGVLVNVYLNSWIERMWPQTRYTYKFLFFPETVGSHAYCSSKENYQDIEMAIFTEMLALTSPLHIQMSENEGSYVTRALKAAAIGRFKDARFTEFLGVIRNDEKVFGSPGIDIPSASVTRAAGREYDHHPYSWYHTSLDTIENADILALREAIEYIQRFIYVLEVDQVLKRDFVGIPMLSRRGLFYDPQHHRDKYNLQEKFAWQVRDPKALVDIAVDLNCDFLELKELAAAWEESGLVVDVGENVERGRR